MDHARHPRLPGSVPVLRSVAIGVVSLVVVACGTAAVGPSTSGSTGAPASPAATGPRPTVTASPTTAAAGTVPNAILLLQAADDSRWQLVEAATGKAVYDLPVGTPREGWGRIVTATIQGDATFVRDSPVQPGLGGPELRLAGRWRLPTVGRDPDLVGRSLDGSTIALVEADPAPTRPSRFAVVEHTFQGRPSTVGDSDLRLVRIVELAGSFEYDTLSPDGRILYVIEHLDAAAGGRYQVRAVDLPAGVMRDAVIVDKLNPDERMSGYPIAQERRPNGTVLTLYDGPEHPFIHALQAADGWAICIDLPATDPAAADGWDLAAAPDGSTAFAVNGTAGIAVELALADLSVRRTAILDRATAGSATPVIRLAKFGHTAVGPVGRRLVIAPDGQRLFAASSDGIVVLDAGSLATIRRDLAGSDVRALGLTPDGSLGFALVAGGRLVAFDPATGRVFGDVPGGPWGRLIAIAPW
jgi:hypothetical protein